MTRTQSHFKRIIRIISFIIIALDAITKIFVIYKRVISKDRDFLFKSNYSQDFKSTNNIFAHVTNFIIFIIQIYNTIIIFI